MTRLGLHVAAAAAVLTVVPVLTTPPVHDRPGGPRPVAAVTAAGAGALAFPALRVTREVTGLAHPWDVQPVGQGRLLITERTSKRLLLWQDGELVSLDYPSSTVWASGETGLMSLAVDPAFAENQRFYTCQGGFPAAGGHDVRVVAWRLDADAGTAEQLRVLRPGIPATSGQHGGCRLLIARNGALLVGTGDAAVGRHPRNKRSLAGKTLRLDRFTGAPWPTNPWPRAASRNRRYVLTYGHRNVQGLAQRADGTLWSAEHGPDRNDEVNRLRHGGDYGWHPVPGYDQTVPMTDHSLPGPQVAARWRSGRPTIATSGIGWVRGSDWDDYAGTLAVAALKGSRVVFMRFDRGGRLVWTRTPAALREFGRLRSISRAPDGDLLVTTANGTDDAVLRVEPRS